MAIFNSYVKLPGYVYGHETMVAGGVFYVRGKEMEGITRYFCNVFFLLTIWVWVKPATPKKLDA